MSRVALVVGINTYDDQRMSNLITPAEGADAIAQLLTDYGDFNVQRLPPRQEVIGSTSPHRVSLTQLETALVQLFKPDGNSIPDTALLYFSGQGLCKDRGIQTSFLATSDVNPNRGNWGLSLQWLRQLLQKSPVRQQIIWLDCYCSGEWLNLAEADPGNRVQDRCFIATSYPEFNRDRSYLTKALLQGLDPTHKPDGVITNYTLVESINQVSQPVIFANSGSPILLTHRSSEEMKVEDCPEKLQPPNLEISPRHNICPYKGLAYFDCNDKDPNYFYGRSALTDQLLEQVRRGNFLAVLGASGSGKSSVLRAGLLHQLKLGQRLSGSHQWPLYIIRPSEHPLQSLALTFINPELSEVDRNNQLAKATELIQMGAVGLAVMVRAVAGQGRVMLVVDQFEEVFTQCRDETEREQFFECLLGGLQRTEHQLCLAIAMRTDFLGKCAERDYSGLAQKLQAHLITVMPMTPEELKEAIVQPAKQVGLTVEPELITQILTDLQGSANLPLLQYTLTELWQRRPVNRLMLAEYARLGGVQGAIQKRANLVYQSLSGREQRVAKQIFLELTQLGEETQDTARQVLKSNLVSEQESAFLVEEVLQKLADARLVVTSEVSVPENSSKTVTVVDIAHEALIRHWPLLRQWLEQQREIIRVKRRIEAIATEWYNQRKPKKTAFLLQGIQLAEAENYLENHSELGLSSLAQELIQKSIQHRHNQRQFQAGALTLGIGILTTVALVATTQWLRTQRLAQRIALRGDVARVESLLAVEPLKGLVLAIQATAQSQSQLQQVDHDVASSLLQAVEVARERNQLQGHESAVSSVAFSRADQTLVSGSYDGTVRLWNQQGNPVGQPVRGHQDWVTAVAFSPDGQTIVSSGKDGTIRLWNWQGQPLGNPFQERQDWITSVAFSPDGLTIVSGGKDGTVRLWNRQGQSIGQPFQGHQGVVFAVAVSSDGQRIVSGSGDGTVRLWNRQGQPMGEPLRGHEGVVFSVIFSPDGQTILSGGRDGTLRMWNRQGQPLGEPFRGHQGPIFAVAFSPDGQTIASGSGDGTIRLWNRQGQLLSEPLRGHQQPVFDVAFSPDSQTLASGSEDRTVRLWDWKSPLINPALPGQQEWQTWLQVACDRLRYHPIFKLPDYRASHDICQAQVWGKE